MDFELAGDCEIQAAYAAQVRRDFELARDYYQVHAACPRARHRMQAGASGEAVLGEPGV
jgi:hypothetical protein